MYCRICRNPGIVVSFVRVAHQSDRSQTLLIFACVRGVHLHYIAVD